MARNTQEPDSSANQNQLLELLATGAFVTNLPTFRGEKEDDIQEYLKLFEDQTVGLDNRVKIIGIRRSFVGSAREWLRENCESELDSSDYIGLKKKILERYARETGALRNRIKLIQMRYEPTGRETLASFIDRFVSLAKKVDLIKDTEIIASILIALPLEVQGDLEYIENMSQVKSLSDLTKVAHRYDSIVSKRTERPSDLKQLGAIVSSISQEEIRKAISGIRDEFQRQHEETIAVITNRNTPSASRTTQGQRRCYNCQQYGHLARACPEPRQQGKGEANQPSDVRQLKVSRDQKETREPREQRKDWSKENEEAVREYERNYGKPEMNCPICNGYHFVYHCPLKTLKE